VNLQVAGVVLTGGGSRRMGTDKALLEIGGVALARRVADVLAAGGCAPVWCQGGDAPALAALGLAVHPDVRPGEGPVAAIAAALEYAGEADGVLVAACDLPGLTARVVADLLHAVARRPDAGDRPLALALAGRAQLVAWWPRSTAEPLGELLAAGVRTYRAALDRLGATLRDTDAAVLQNVNTPGDLA
jgi:molybdopterin-guanine dinucleotide biosynthesis protein A